MIEMAIILMALVVMSVVMGLILGAMRRRLRCVLAELVELRALELLQAGDGDDDQGA